MFTTFIAQPIFNLLVAIYALLPGHNFGLALILFTIVIRTLLWPLLRRQLRHTKITRQLQPELKRIKKEAKGDRQKESLMMMELYKERGINPLGSLPTLIVQAMILIGLYMGLVKVIKDPAQISSFAYPFLQKLDFVKEVASNHKLFDNTLFGVVDLSRAAVSNKGLYWPALLLVIGSAGIQFLSTKQLMPVDKDARSLKEILKATSEGEEIDFTEKNAAIGRSTQYLIPFMVLVFTINLASALSLYWLVGGIVGYIQQRIALKEDEEDMRAVASGKPIGSKSKFDTSNIVEGEVVFTTPTKNKKQPAKNTKKRRRR